MLRKVANEKTLLNAYHAFTGSTLKYGILFWGNSTGKENALRAQKRCIRAICGLKKLDACKPHFIRLKLLTLPSLYIYESALTLRNNLSQYQTFKSERHNTILCQPRHRTALYRNSTFIMQIKIYNNLPPCIKETNNIDIFKFRLKQFLIPKAYYKITDFLKDKECRNYTCDK